MRGPRQVNGILVAVEAVAAPRPELSGGDGPGVRLGFGAPQRGPGSRSWASLGCDRIDDVAPLRAADDVDSILGLARVIRVLRAARIAPPSDPCTLLDDPETAAALVARAIGTPFLLLLRPRASVHFKAWTERGLARVPDVVDVAEEGDAFWVRPRRGGAVRVARGDVVRTETECLSWYEVAAIERAG